MRVVYWDDILIIHIKSTQREKVNVKIKPKPHGREFLNPPNLQKMLSRDRFYGEIVIAGHAQVNHHWL